MTDRTIGNPLLDSAIFMAITSKNEEAYADLLKAFAEACRQRALVYVAGDERQDSGKMEIRVMRGNTGKVWCCLTSDKHAEAMRGKVNCYALPLDMIFRLACEDGIDGIVFNPDKEPGLEISLELIRDIVKSTAG